MFTSSSSELSTSYSLHSPLDMPAAVNLLNDAIADSDKTSVLVDFDETLFLENSTEAYLRSVRPKFLAFLVLAAVDLIKPWRLSKSKDRAHVYRDWFRVLLIAVLMPWSLLVWRFFTAPKLAKSHANSCLLQALERSKVENFSVVSFGFGLIIKPLLVHIAPGAKLYAGSLSDAYKLRRQGKRRWIEGILGEELVATSIFITDSEADADILSACGTPVLMVWPMKIQKPAFSDMYYPLMYTLKVKRPNSNYAVNGLLLGDIAALSLAYAWIMANPIIGVIAIAVLHLSMWAIYEVGYYWNDRSAIEREADGVIPSTFKRYADRISYRRAWMAAAPLALVGATLLYLAETESSSWTFSQDTFLTVGVFTAAWIIFNIAGQLLFRLYNRSIGDTRAILYLPLQLVRFGGYGFIMASTTIGAMIVAAIVLSRWIPYAVYRVSAKRWDRFNKLLTLTIFSMLSFLLVTVGPLHLDYFYQFLAAWLWFGVRARKELISYLRRFEMLPKRGAPVMER